VEHNPQARRKCVNRCGQDPLVFRARGVLIRRQYNAWNSIRNGETQESDRRLSAFGLDSGPCAPRKVIGLAQAIEHGASNAPPSIGTKRAIPAGIVLGGGVDQAQPGVLVDILEIELAWQPLCYIARDAGSEPEIVDYELLGSHSRGLLAHAAGIGGCG
jgi:hypothetical protein